MRLLLSHWVAKGMHEGAPNAGWTPDPQMQLLTQRLAKDEL